MYKILLIIVLILFTLPFLPFIEDRMEVLFKWLRIKMTKKS